VSITDQDTWPHNNSLLHRIRAPGARVAIASITDQSTRRRLLAASVAVSTEVTVALAPLSAVLWLSASSHTLSAVPCVAASPLLGMGVQDSWSLTCLAASPLALSANGDAADCQRGAGPEG